MMNKMTGRCLCGKIHFQINGRPIWTGHCHCLSCRRQTGSAVATFLGFDPKHVIFTSGQAKIYSSSPGVRRGFCGDCGTPIYFEADKYAGEIHIYLSTLNNPELYPAQFHVHFAERIEWFEIDDELPRYARGSENG